MTFPLLATIWALGDLNIVHFISGGGPALTTHVLATLGIRGCVRTRRTTHENVGVDIRPAAADPAGDLVDAQVGQRRGADLIVARHRLNHWITHADAIALLTWTLTPLYNMVLVGVQEKEDVFATNIWSPAPTLDSFAAVIHETYWLLANFWVQIRNSFFIGVTVCFLTMTIGSLTAFAVGRLRIGMGLLLSNTALLTYVIPMSFLAIPFYGIMRKYGLADNPWSVIAVEVPFATPHAIFIFTPDGSFILRELDEAACIDDASPPQIYFGIYLPLMAPALVAIGAHSLLLAWNEYLYAFLLLSFDKAITVPVALGKFLDSGEAQWNHLMASAIIYPLPPFALDNAICHEAAAIKHIVSPVAGRANLLLVPDLEAATCWRIACPSCPGLTVPESCWGPGSRSF